MSSASVSNIRDRYRFGRFFENKLTWYFLCWFPKRFRTFPQALQTLLLHILSIFLDRLNLRLSICLGFTHWQLKKVHIYSSHIGNLKFINSNSQSSAKILQKIRFSEFEIEYFVWFCKWIVSSEYEFLSLKINIYMYLNCVNVLN